MVKNEKNKKTLVLKNSCFCHFSPSDLSDSQIKLYGGYIIQINK